MATDAFVRALFFLFSFWQGEDASVIVPLTYDLNDLDV